MPKSLVPPVTNEGTINKESLEDVLQSIGDHVKAVRLQENLSQKELASRAKVSRSAIQTLEGGGGTVSTLVAVLMELGVLDEILASLEKDISRKVKNKVRRGGRASSRGGFSKKKRPTGPTLR